MTARARGRAPARELHRIAAAGGGRGGDGARPAGPLSERDARWRRRWPSGWCAGRCIGQPTVRRRWTSGSAPRSNQPATGSIFSPARAGSPGRGVQDVPALGVGAPGATRGVLAAVRVPDAGALDDLRQGVEETGPLVQRRRAPEVGDSRLVRHLAVLPVQLRERLDVIAGEGDRHDQHVLLAPARRAGGSPAPCSARASAPGPTSDWYVRM